MSSVPVPTYLDLVEMEGEARRRIGEMAYAYYAGGAEDEAVLADNVAAWRRWRLLPRVLVDVTSVSTATTILGVPVASPVMVAPTALHAMVDPDGEVATARGAAAANACMVMSSLANRSLEDVAAGAPGAPRWMQVYVLRDRDRTGDMVKRAAAAGYSALAVTVDAPVGGLRRRELEGRVRLPDDLALPNIAGPGEVKAHEGAGGFMAAVAREFDAALTFDDIGWLTDVSGLPVVVKGVLRADDARRCVDAGAAGVVVSNHGARQLDDVPATADVLAEIVDAVGGRGEIYVDGGVRRPSDVVKALALGARGVLLGRPVLWALSTGGSGGVCALLSWFTAELRRAMTLVGAPTVQDIDRSLVRRSVP
ncbi:MAG: alpha-hydroxy acid oxidase [Acidimicrobiales bacterium]